MEPVGEILKNRREQKNLTLFDVSKELNISEDILANIEKNYFQNNIDIVFIIGHLRSYSIYLDLDYNEIIQIFKKQNFSKEKKNIEIERPRFEYGLLLSNKLISFTLIMGIFGAFYFLFIKVDKSQREYALIPDLPENYISIVEEANTENFVKNNNTDTELENNIEIIKNFQNSSSAIASLPNTEEKKSPIITLKFLDDTWVQVRDKNDEIILSQLMNKDDEYTYEMLTYYSITSGNAGHIMVLIDNKVRGKIGKKGQVVDTLVIKQDFSN